MSTLLKLPPHFRTQCLRQCTASNGTFRGLSSNRILLEKLPATPETAPSPPPKFPMSALSYHWDTRPPNPSQLAHAAKFFEKIPPKFIWSAEKFKTIDFGSSPEICFLGRSNVGKSSLLNTLLGRKIAHTSSKPGRTKLMNAFAVGGSEDNGKNRLIVLDMPGYGKGGRAEWGKEIVKYLEKRKELRRAFLLIEAEHGIKESDRQILAMFKDHNVPFQVVLAKADKILFPTNRNPRPEVLESRFTNLRKTMESVREAILDLELERGEVGEVIACSSEKKIEGKRLGMDAVRFAMLQAAGLELEQKIVLPKAIEVVPYKDLVYLKNSPML